MARDFARQFYNSRTWQTTRSAYMEHCRGLCERCLQKGLIVPAEIVHHKEELTPSNITDVDIAVGFGNLEALCRPCHAEVHEETYHQRELRSTRRKRRWKFDKRSGEFCELTPLPLKNGAARENRSEEHTSELQSR